MYTIEQIKERVRQLQVEIDALADPRDEPIPRKRQELQERFRQLTDERNQWHIVVSTHANMERKMAPLLTYRDGLNAGRAKLESDLPAAQAALDAARQQYRRDIDYRPEQRRVEAIEAAIESISGPGYGSSGVPNVLRDAVAAVTVNFTWLHYSLPHVEHLISNLREQWLEALSRLGDTDAARVLALRKELWKVEEDIANERDVEVIEGLSAERKQLLDELVALGEFATETAAVAAYQDTSSVRVATVGGPID